MYIHGVVHVYWIYTTWVWACSFAVFICGIISSRALFQNPGHVISKTVGGLFTIEEEEVEEEREGEDSAFNDSGMETILEGEEEEEGAENVQKQGDMHAHTL